MNAVHTGSSISAGAALAVVHVDLTVITCEPLPTLTHVRLLLPLSPLPALAAMLARVGQTTPHIYFTVVSLEQFRTCAVVGPDPVHARGVVAARGTRAFVHVVLARASGVSLRALAVEARRNVVRGGGVGLHARAPVQARVGQTLVHVFLARGSREAFPAHAQLLRGVARGREHARGAVEARVVQAPVDSRLAPRACEEDWTQAPEGGAFTAALPAVGARGAEAVVRELAVVAIVTGRTLAGVGPRARDARGVVEARVGPAPVQRLAHVPHVVFGTQTLEVPAGGPVGGQAPPTIQAGPGGAHVRQLAPISIVRLGARAPERLDQVRAGPAVHTRPADAVIDVDVTVTSFKAGRALAGVLSPCQGRAGHGVGGGARVLLAGFELCLAERTRPARGALTGVAQVLVHAGAVVDARVLHAVVHAVHTPFPLHLSLPLPLPAVQTGAGESVPIVLAVGVGGAWVDVTHAVSMATGLQALRPNGHALRRTLTLKQGHGDLVEGQVPHAAFEMADHVTVVTCRGKGR